MKDSGSWLGTSKRTYGNCSGGGGSKGGKSGPSTFAREGKKDGGIGDPTEYGKSSGGGKGPKGKDRAQNNPTGIGYGGVGKKPYGRKKN